MLPSPIAHNFHNILNVPVSIGCGAAHTAWQIAMSETQRQAIYADPKWNNGNNTIHHQPTHPLDCITNQYDLIYLSPTRTLSVYSFLSISDLTMIYI